MSRNAKIIKNLSTKKIIALSNIFLLVLVMVLRVFVADAQAAALTEASIRLDRMGAGAQFNTTTGYKVLVVVKPTTVGTVGKIRVTFPTTSAFTIDTTAANFATTTTGIPANYQGETLTAATITGNVASAVSGGAITFDASNISSATNLYGFFITCTATTCITNPSAGNAGTHLVTVETLTAASAAIDSQSVAVDTVGTNADQVTVTASVPSTFNFALNSNSIALGTLSTTARTTGNVTADIDTNANNGYIVWIRSEGGAATLASASSADSISSTGTAADATATTTSIGTKDYVVDAQIAAGTGTGTRAVAAEFDGDSSTSGGTLSNIYQEVVTNTGQANNDTLTLTTIVTISGITKAATDYTDTWEVIGAANF